MTCNTSSYLSKSFEEDADEKSSGLLASFLRSFARPRSAQDPVNMYFPKEYTNQHSMAILRASEAFAFDEEAATPTTVSQKTEWSKG
jgi:hypothetical protein